MSNRKRLAEIEDKILPSVENWMQSDEAVYQEASKQFNLELSDWLDMYLSAPQFARERLLKKHFPKFTAKHPPAPPLPPGQEDRAKEELLEMVNQVAKRIKSRLNTGAAMGSEPKKN